MEHVEAGIEEVQERCATLRDSWRRFANLYDKLGSRFFMVLITIEHLLQAFVYGGGGGGFVGVPIQFLLRQYGLTASRIQVLKTIAVSPWALKPLFGLVSDTLYCGGYSRLPYMLATTLLACVACVTIVMGWPLSPVAATLLFFLLFLQIAVNDLLLEAAYCEKTAKHPDVAPDLVSLNSIGSCVFQLGSVLLVGLCIKYMPVEQLQYVYLVPLPFLLLALYPLYQNWMQDREYVYQETYLVQAEAAGPSDEVAEIEVQLHDEPLSNACGSCGWYFRRGEVHPMPIVGLDREKMRANWRIVVLGALIGALSLATSLVGLLDLSTLTLFIMSLVGAPLMIGCFFALVDRRIAKIQAFVIVQNMFALSLDAATFFFYTDTAEQYPEGPHFSAFFYVTVMGALATLLALVGALSYQVWMTRWRYRTVILVTSLLYVAVSSTNLVFFSRLNVAWGIPDWLFVLGSEGLQVVTAVWSSLPFSVMMLQLCPPGLEASMYALLAGSSNLGSALSQYQGAFVLDALGIRPTGAPGESAQFQQMWIAVLLNTVLPLVPLLLLPVLIPDAAQTDSLLSEPTEPQWTEMREMREMREMHTYYDGSFGSESSVEEAK